MEIYIKHYAIEGKANLLKNEAEKISIGNQVTFKFVQSEKYQYKIQLSTKDNETYSYLVNPSFKSYCQ